MLKKRFYDTLSIVFIILVFITLYLQFTSFSKNQDKAFDCYSQGYYEGEALENCLRENEFSKTPHIFKLIFYLFVGIYWLFILVLSINLHKKNLTKTIDVVIIAIIIPLAIIFYLTNLSKSLKKYQNS